MRKALCRTMLSALGLFFTLSAPSYANATPEPSCALFRDAFVSYQLEPISRMLAERFGDRRSFMVDDVAVRNFGPQYLWEATLRVTTFEGPHNPPYREYVIRIARRGSADSPFIEEAREVTNRR